MDFSVAGDRCALAKCEMKVQHDKTSKPNSILLSQWSLSEHLVYLQKLVTLGRVYLKFASHSNDMGILFLYKNCVYQYTKR